MEKLEKSLPLHQIDNRTSAERYVHSTLPPITSTLLEHSEQVTKSSGDRKYLGRETDENGKSQMKFAEATKLVLNQKGELIIKAFESKLAESSLSYILHEHNSLNRYLSSSAAIENSPESQHGDFPELSAKLTLADKVVAAALQKSINKSLTKAVQAELDLQLEKTGVTDKIQNPEEYISQIKSLVCESDLATNWGAKIDELNNTELYAYAAENLANGNITVENNKLVNKLIIKEQQEKQRIAYEAEQRKAQADRAKAIEDKIKAPGGRRSFAKTLQVAGVLTGFTLIGANFLTQPAEGRKRDPGEKKTTPVVPEKLTPVPTPDKPEQKKDVDSILSQADAPPDPDEYRDGLKDQKPVEQGPKPEFLGNELPKLGNIQLVQRTKLEDRFTLPSATYPGDQVHAPEVFIIAPQVIINGVARERIKPGAEAGLQIAFQPKVYKGYDRSRLSPDSASEGYSFQNDDMDKPMTVTYSTSDGTGYDGIKQEDTKDSSGNTFRDAILLSHSRNLKIGDKLIDHPAEAIREYIDETNAPVDTIPLFDKPGEPSIESNCDQITGTVVKIIQPETGKEVYAVISVDRISPENTTRIYNGEITMREAINLTRQERNARTPGLNLPEVAAQNPRGELWFSGCANRTQSERHEERKKAESRNQAEWEQAKLIIQFIVITEQQKEIIEKARQDAIAQNGYVDRATFENFRASL